MKQQRRFTKEFEDEVVRLVRTSGRTGRQIAEDLGGGLPTLVRSFGRSLYVLVTPGCGSRELLAAAPADSPILYTLHHMAAVESYLPRGPRSPRRGNPAAMVRQGHRSHHAMPGAVLDRHPAGVTPRLPCPAAGLGHGLVPQAATELCRQSRRSTTCDLEGAGFCHAPAVGRHRETPTSPPRKHSLCSLPRGLNGQSRAQPPFWSLACLRCTRRRLRAVFRLRLGLIRTMVHLLCELERQTLAI